MVIYFIGLETNFKMIGNLSFEHYSHLIMGILFLIFVLWFSYKKEASYLIITIPCVFIIIVLIVFTVYAFLNQGLLRLATLMRWIFIYLTYILISYDMSATSKRNAEELNP